MNKKLTKPTKKKGGRSGGRVAVRHKGGGHKRRIREIDWQRDKENVPGVVKAIEYDPNRSANVALVLYEDGEYRYILATQHMEAGDKVMAGPEGDIEEGNAMKLERIPLGKAIHNLEIQPGKGAQMIRSAGAQAVITAKEEGFAHVRLPSGELRKFPLECKATIGRVGNIQHGAKKLKKAGDKRHRGIRPTVRGVVQHPGSHPHGGGEGRSGVGLKSPKTPWGKKTLGKKTRKKNKYSDKYIIERRDEGKKKNND